MTREQQILARSEVTVVTETTYRLPKGAPLEDAFDTGSRVHPTRVTVREIDGEYSISVTGYKVEKDGTHKGASWHSVSIEAQRRYEAALGFTRVPKQ